jgi:amino acid adenylation domain-containing protein
MIDEIFRRTAARHPHHVAVRGWDHELTYRELDRRVDRFARRLWAAGVRPGSVVGLHLEGSAAAIWALLAILRAGAAYLALDPRQPVARRQFILRDAGVEVVVTRSGLASELADSCVTIDVHDATADPSTVGSGCRADGVRLDQVAGPAHVAYLAYTSGSTGAPKGVSVPHRAVVRLVLDNDYLPIGLDDVFVQYAPLAFDASTLEVWGPLCNGACLVIPPPGEPTPAELCAFVGKAGGTVLWLTAGLFHRVVEADLAQLRGLRHLLAGGDVLSPPHVNRALAALPGTVLVNGYGPTENTTFTCCHRMTSAVRSPTVPIGRPIRGSTAYVLDDRLRAVADGEVGELYTGGLGVAHGYVGDPALTAQRFLPDPFAPGPGARMYRTGDLVRWRSGALEFLGRADRQVKVRGFRIELAEVESALAELPDVAEAAVVARRDRSGEHRLAGFVTGPASTLDVRRRLADILPRYAIPASITRLDSLPLTPNGKLDRTQLEGRVAQARPELSSPHREPEAGLEAAVTRLWSDLLELDGIGADDDFFELGGHSLLGVEILGELRREYGVEIAPLTFYLDPTPSGLARAVGSTRHGGEFR